MGAIGAIVKYGTPAQRKLATELVLSGDKPAICITEPEAGSAATQMTTRADRRGDRYVLNGKKHWITGGGVSRLHLIFARVFDEKGAEQGIGGFIVVRDPQAATPKGLIVGKREPAMGLRGIPETELIFDNLEVPDDMLLQPPRGLRHGFADLMDAYNGQRIGAATVALGLAQGAYEHALRYANQREQFGRPIAEFQGLQWIIADMSIGAGGLARPDLEGRRQRAAAAASPTSPTQRAPRSWPPRRRSRSPTTRCRSSARRDTPATTRWSAMCATRACSRSPAAPRRSCATSSPRRCSAGASRRRATGTRTSTRRKPRSERTSAVGPPRLRSHPHPRRTVRARRCSAISAPT